MPFRILPLLLAGWAVVLLGVAGCGSSPGTRFYSLASLQDSSGSTTVDTQASKGIIAVGPVELADYLNRPQIVQRTGETRIALQDFDHWAGSLKDDLARVLVDNLKVHLSSGGYLLLPWEETALPDRRIQIRVARLEATDRKAVVLEAMWMLLGEERGDIRLAGEEFIEEPTEGSDVEAQVEAMGRAVAELSRRIGAQVKEELGEPEQ